MISLESIESYFSDTSLPEAGDEPIFPSPEPVPEEQRLRVQRDIKPAAVLVPIVDRREPTVLLTQRAQHLRNHAGQVSFPGGRIEAAETPEQAALRETHEEVGLLESHIKILGYMPKYVTGTGFSVYPIVARVQPGFELKIDHFEVEEAFEVPLSHALDQKQYAVTHRQFGTTRLSFYETFYDNYRIWGATAAMLVGLSKMLIK